MWDLKLHFIDFFFITNFWFLTNVNLLIAQFDPIFGAGLSFLNWNALYIFPQNAVFFFAIKFCAAIMLLILIRGGTPRYRYDYLTKLGWLKFLGVGIAIFFFSLLSYFLF
jgi:NADH:ubiquinone oxidoreductase subunit H